jgi:hypothetical protein
MPFHSTIEKFDMPVSAPPFDPPYVSMHVAEERTEYIETLADGTTRPVVEAAFGVAWHYVQGGSGTSQNEAQPALRSQRPRSSSSGSDRFYLNVPYAEKDEAKALGARWDAAKKKWYAPQGVEPGQFERWLPKA